MQHAGARGPESKLCHHEGADMIPNSLALQTNKRIHYQTWDTWVYHGFQQYWYLLVQNLTGKFTKTDPKWIIGSRWGQFNLFQRVGGTRSVHMKKSACYTFCFDKDSEHVHRRFVSKRHELSPRESEWLFCQTHFFGVFPCGILEALTGEKIEYTCTNWSDVSTSPLN